MLRISFSSHGERAFSTLLPDVQQRVVDALFELAKDTQWYLRVKKLGGSENRYRLRVGRWRVLFWQNGNSIEVADIFMKKSKSDYQKRIRLK